MLSTAPDLTPRTSRVFHRRCDAPLPTAVAGEGPYVIDANGKRYLDACSGAAVSSLGYNHPRIIEAAQQQIAQLSYVHCSFFTSDAAEMLADLLVEQAPAGLDRVYYVSGGSEAVEAALKMARQYFVEAGETQRKWFISRRQSYHGNTLGALSVGGNQWRRDPFEPLLTESHHVAPCYAYRHRQEGETVEEYGQRTANELEHKLLELGPENVIAFIAEPVVGATAGAVPAVPGYFRRVREICDRYGILLILDEVMCGMGRTGTLFACEQEGISPDIVTIAKGLGAGYQPIGSVLASAEVHDRIRDGSGYFHHGHTYMAHTAAAAAALAVQQTVIEEDLLQQVRLRGQQLRERLYQRFADHPHVGDIRGRGLFLGLELVADRSDKSPFPGNSRLDAMIKQHAMQNGLMCYPMGGTIDGKSGHHVLLAPPFIVNESQLDEITEKLGNAIDASIPRALHV